MKTIVIAVFIAIIGICAFFAYTLSDERKIEQENGKGLYAPNITYKVLQPPPWPTPGASPAASPARIAEVIKEIDRQLPLATVAIKTFKDGRRDALPARQARCLSPGTQ